MHVLDTNAVIYYLKADPAAVKSLEPILLQNLPLVISTITEAELFGSPDLTEKEIERIDTILSTLTIVPLDSHLARGSGFARRSYQLKIPDAVIAATALFTYSVHTECPRFQECARTKNNAHLTCFRK